MDDEQQTRQTGGSVPHAWGNALARQWAPALPRPLVGGFLTTLYVLRVLASADGHLRYARDGAAVTITQIATAARSDQRDVRDYLRAAVAAGVVTVVQAAPGRAVEYALLVCPAPDWERAAGMVWIAQQKKKEARAAKAARAAARAASAAAEDTPTPGDSPPTPQEQTSGDSPLGSEEEGSGDSPPRGVGGLSPGGVGGQSPEHPGSTHVLPHEVAEVVPQPQDVRGRASEKKTSGDQENHRRCASGCGQPVIRPDRLVCAGCERRTQPTPQQPSVPVQGAFMISVPSRAPARPPSAPPARQGSWPQVDPYAPQRTCGCGRTYHAEGPGPCPDCLDAAAHDRTG
ncbi:MULTISPECIES: hypothetical protein [unclassified Streptomyces]|uniref:hypothetical protein n=1 Tax=unclassified Streptomyces TaxID=2593676 RepID=UPI00166016ED|nr:MULTISPECIES: hypothetical protein [unclassified Streptomyces]MBD0707372.1 hypothetical protein [Streptomyces sp. CBMA291]MBD0715176.1 hypothetical protein [Streptomyces sp. CBMA370]